MILNFNLSLLISCEGRESFMPLHVDGRAAKQSNGGIKFPGCMTKEYSRTSVKLPLSPNGFFQEGRIEVKR
jgi:hypothetical protein